MNAADKQANLFNVCGMLPPSAELLEKIRYFMLANAPELPQAGTTPEMLLSRTSISCRAGKTDEELPHASGRLHCMCQGSCDKRI